MKNEKKRKSIKNDSKKIMMPHGLIDCTINKNFIIYKWSKKTKQSKDFHDFSSGAVDVYGDDDDDNDGDNFFYCSTAIRVTTFYHNMKNTPCIQSKIKYYKMS